MSAIVLDCSLAMHLGLPDEKSVEAERLLGRLGPDVTFWVPAVWWCEVANALVTAERRGRVSEASALSVLSAVRQLPVETDVSYGPEMVWLLRTLGREHGLSAYDVAYLELAARRKIPLATLDRALSRAARNVGLEILA